MIIHSSVCVLPAVFTGHCLEISIFQKLSSRTCSEANTPARLLPSDLTGKLPCVSYLITFSSAAAAAQAGKRFLNTQATLGNRCSKRLAALCESAFSGVMWSSIVRAGKLDFVLSATSSAVASQFSYPRLGGISNFSLDIWIPRVNG